MTSGHIDDCIRKAIAEGCEPEHAYRMATLSPAERFQLSDRGAISPGRLADFCLISSVRDCQVTATYKRGVLISADEWKPVTSSFSEKCPFFTKVPTEAEIQISGSGIARVIKILEGQIGTKAECITLNSEDIPDIKQDILKIVVASRYYPDNIGTGLVQGFKLKQGALASSVSHDSYNVIAIGTSDKDIISSIASVVRHKGAMVATDGDKEVCLPLSLAGLMSELPYEQVQESLIQLQEMTSSCGAINDPFMYLSFLALSVIPEIRVTTKGIFDVNRFSHVPLFIESLEDA